MMKNELTDRELLERAAKAAGLTAKWSELNEDWQNEIASPYVDGKMWNPLRFDGDALRLAVRLSLDIFTNDGDGGHTSVGGGTAVFVQEKHGTDRLAATRRAIVRAAAALADSEPK